MYENLFEDGSVLGVLLLVYSANVAIELLRVTQSPHGSAVGPAIAHTTLGTIFVFAALPCVIWPYVYVGMFDGIPVALASWFILQIAGGIMTTTLGLVGPFLGLHSIVALGALPIGYFLTLTNLP